MCKEEGSCYDKDKSIDKESEIESDGRVYKIVLDSAEDTDLIFTIATGLDEGRMQVQIVRHHSRAKYADGNIERPIIERGRYETNAAHLRHRASQKNTSTKKHIPIRDTSPNIISSI